MSLLSKVSRVASLTGLVLLLGLPSLTHAHAPADIDPSKSMRAVRITAAAPRIDGRLDDDIWARAPSFSGLTQANPDDGEPATEKTVVQFAYDDDAFYVAMVLHYSDPAQIVDDLTRRDRTHAADRFRIEIDTHHDHQSANMFELSAAGVQRDGQVTKNGDSFDVNWDAVWEGQVASHAEGLSAEWRIPYQALRFHAAKRHTWGVNLVRYIQRKHETAYWVRVPRNARGWVSRFGHLEGLEGISPPRALELLPYSVGRGIHYPGGSRDTDLSSRVGADLRYGLGRSATISATINPDFGQVEADPAELNLTVFETFQSERRPFFVQGAQMFRTPINLFYSRRVGRQPGHLSGPTGWNESHRPESTTVLGAVKLTGRTLGRTSFGLMEAVTAQEHARIDSAGVERDALIEPRSNYLTARLIRDVLRNSHVGLLATSLQRGRGNDAWSGGVDWKLNTHDNDYEFAGQVAGSQTGVGTGWGADVEWGKRTGRWQAELGVQAFSPDFDINDTGFLRRADVYHPRLELELDNREPWKIFRTSDLWLERWRRSNFDDVVLEDAVEAGGWGQLLNYWGFGGGYTHRYGASDDRDTRGGPLIATPASDSYWVSVESDWRAPTSGWVNFSWSTDSAGSSTRSLRGGLTLRPSTSLEVRLRPSYSWNHADAQWISNVDDDEDGATDHYIYGELGSKTLDFTTRANIILSPRLSLEANVQPFVTVGDFKHFKELAQANSYQFTQVTEPESNPDFRRRSLRSNLVLRWEYRPGSTLFLVWSQNRGDRSGRPRLRPLSNLGNTFSDAGTNVLFVKATYWSSL
ncbi:MAG: carbohydrate binding family 9 domain-containing protein [Gemmatimonadetes bacterium]|nr:carbohydrate binding family 9 domain-containing protein [Gemmatimonadota bacterium]